MMAHIYFLAFYTTLIFLPTLHSLPLFKPLLHPSYEKLSKIEDGDPATLFLDDSFTKFQAVKYTETRGQEKSVFGIAKGKIKNFVTHQPQTPSSEKKILISWEVCYDLSQKVIDSSPSDEVKAMANAVREIGPQSDHHQYFSQVEMQQLKSAINLFSFYLEMDSLNTAERIWAVGVLSYLKSRIPEARTSKIPAVWTANDLGRPRTDALLFFLKDKDMGKVVKEMWSEVPPKAEISELVIQEAIQRESTVHLIKRQIDVAPGEPSPEFYELFLAFINLKTPVDSQKASSLMELIKKNLESSKRQMWSSFDEEANIVRLLLHLEEYHYPSYQEFQELIKTNEKVREKIIHNDISLQLSEETLPPSVSDLLKEFQNIKTLHDYHIHNILQTLKQEEMSIQELGRFFRVLNLVFKRNREMATRFKLQLNELHEMIPELVDKLVKYRFSRVNPKSFLWDNLESLMILKSEDLVALNYMNDLAKDLVSRGVLSEREIAQQHSVGESKADMVDRILYRIFKRMLEAKKYNPQSQTDDVLVEYILQLIAFKNDRTELRYQLLDLIKDPEKSPFRQTPRFGPARERVLDFVYSTSWDIDGQISEFSKALRKLEESILKN